MNDLGRGQREKIAYDVDNSFDTMNHKIHGVLAHVRQSPNTLYGLKLFDNLIGNEVAGRSVLEIGCGTGYLCKKILDELGADRVHGIDVSTRMLDEAYKIQEPGLKFFEHDVHLSWPHKYDVIFGKAVLHHVDYLRVLKGLYENNLNPGGTMVFMEPMAENLLMKLYWKFGTRFHTPDERPFYSKDIQLLKDTFPGFELQPINYLTIPLGVVSSIILKNPNNFITRFADRFDRYVEKKFRSMHSRFRSGIFIIRKPRD